MRKIFSLCLTVVVASSLMFAGCSPKKSKSLKGTDFLMNDADVFASVKLASAGSSEFVQLVTKTLEGMGQKVNPDDSFKKATGIDLADVKCVDASLVVEQEAKNMAGILAVSFSKPVSEKAIVDVYKKNGDELTKEAPIAGVTIYKEKDGSDTVAIINDKLVIIAGFDKGRAHLLSVLNAQKDGKPVKKLNAETLATITSDANVVLFKTSEKTLKQVPPGAPPALKDAETVALYIELTKDLGLKVIGAFKNEKSADEIKKIMDNGLKMVPMMLADPQMAMFKPMIEEVLKSAKVSGAGKTVEAELKITEKVLDAAKMIAPMLMMMMGSMS